MRKRSLLLAFLTVTFALPLVAQTAPGFGVDIVVTNQSDTCAWVTLYDSRPGLKWSIVGGVSRPRFLKARDSYTFTTMFTNLLGVPYPAEVKVRAEFMKNNNCDHPKVDDRERETTITIPAKAGVYQQLASSLGGAKGREGYSVSLWKK